MAQVDINVEKNKELAEGMEEVRTLFKALADAIPDLVDEARESGDEKFLANMEKASNILVDEMGKLGASYAESGEKLTEYFKRIADAQRA